MFTYNSLSNENRLMKYNKLGDVPKDVDAPKDAPKDKAKDEDPKVLEDMDSDVEDIASMAMEVPQDKEP